MQEAPTPVEPSYAPAAAYDVDDDDFVIWRPGDQCATSARYAVHTGLAGRWYDQSGIDREQYVASGERFPATPAVYMYWRYADLSRHRRGCRSS